MRFIAGLVVVLGVGFLVSEAAAQSSGYGPNHPAMRQQQPLSKVPPAVPPGDPTPVGPNGFVCDVYSKSEGKTVRVVHLRGPTQRWIAEARPQPYPTIVYSPAFYSMTQQMQRFVQYHECGHLAVPTSNEFAANCFALERMRQEGSLTPDTLNHIRRSVSGSGMIPSNYGGSGAEFWRGTVNRCPSAAQ